ncbi:50S ribosomal protein L18e [Methanolobus bombayensis]|uniref:50S ribosomal protein L18e n=1 Tax=Methanolobus bombayensis TaxID=38023 RepID=UPI001AEB67EA|nr:50S ribosomal protein L18e [Methanolobus bombayensis]MBP1910183.1 large subunit ribosomal protein L18e [Methanolobus bombayensis]
MSKNTNAKIQRKTNPRTPVLIAALKEEARQNEVAIWRDVAKKLEKPGKNYAQVNLSKINRYAKDGETVLIAGKVLGSGLLEKAVTVAAYNFSATAMEKIAEVGGKCLTIEQIMEENPKGSGIRILQ